MNTTRLLGIVAIAAIFHTSALATVIYSDTFDGNTNANLATQTFSTAATTDFDHWAIGTSGNMDEGYFSVVNKASDVHSLFTSSLDADNNVNGFYSIYNGFQSADGLAYSKSLAVNVGDTITFSAALITLAANPPFAQDSWIEFRANGIALGSVINLVPVPAGTETWTTYSRSFVAASSSVLLEIVNLGGPSNAGNDFGVDNISVEAVPEPATIAILGLATAALARRKRSN